MNCLDDPEEKVKIEIAVVVEGYAETPDAAYSLVHRFQTSLNGLVEFEFHPLSVSLCQATCGDIEEGGWLISRSGYEA